MLFLRNWKRWQVTSLFAWAGLAVCAALSAIALALNFASGTYTILSIPSGVFAGVVIVPAALVALVFIHANRQEAVDRSARPGER
jgi:uncharacterized membrane protein